MLGAPTHGPSDQSATWPGLNFEWPAPGAGSAPPPPGAYGGLPGAARALATERLGAREDTKSSFIEDSGKTAYGHAHNTGQGHDAMRHASLLTPG